MEENAIPNIFKTCNIKEDRTIESFSEIFDEGDYFKDNILENPGDQETLDSLEKAHSHRDQLEPLTKDGAESLEKEPAIGKDSAYITTAILNRTLNEQDLYEDEGSVSARCNDKGAQTDKVLSQSTNLREGISSTLIDLDGHVIHARDDFMNIKTEKLIEAVDVMKEELGSGLVACDIFDQSGLSYSRHNSRSAGTVLFANMTAKLRKILKDSGFPTLSRYYMLVLESNQIVVIGLVGDLQIGILVDGNQVNLGLLLNLIVEKALKVMKAAE